MSQLSKKIMRRVYYVYTLRLLSHALVTHTVLIAFSFFILSQMVSIPSIWANLMQVKVGEMANFFISALAGTQFGVIVSLAVLLLTTVSLLVSLFKSKRFELVMDREAEWV